MSTALTVKQVAEMLSVNERTVYRMAQRGDLPAFKVAGTWRFLEQDIMGWNRAAEAGNWGSSWLSRKGRARCGAVRVARMAGRRRSGPSCLSSRVLAVSTLVSNLPA